MEIFVRASQHKIDPKHPESTDPTFQRAWDAGQKRMREGKLKFKDRGEEEHYWKMTKSNPMNVPGLPPFAPPEVMRSYVAITPQELDEQEMIEKFYTEKAVKQTVLHCGICEGVTLHMIGPRQSFCQICGTLKPYHNS